MDEVNGADKSQEIGGAEKGGELSNIDVSQLANANPKPNSRQVAQALSEIQDPRTRHTIQEFLSINATSKPQAYGPDALIDKMPEEQCLEAFQTIMGIPRYKIEKESEDRQKSREFEERKDSRHLRFLVFVIIVVVVFVVWALIMGHTEVATHTITAIVSIGLGAFGGFGYGRQK